VAEIIDDTEHSRFEARVDDQVAELVYRRRADRLILVHTGVPRELEGQGLGGQLVEAAVDRAARECLTLVPLCPFARVWLQRHSDAAAKAKIDWTAG
jgi:predicted GNAT family acetyltransferase